MTGATLEARLKEKIRKANRNVFLRSDFENLGGYDQVGRALKRLVNQGRLMRLGYGVYAKARKNRLTGNTMLAAPGGFDQVSKEALDRLGVQWRPAQAEESYQRGGTQIPARTVVRIKGNFNRNIGIGRTRLHVEPLQS